MIKEIIKNAQKQPISFHFNTRLSIIISGNERAVMLINKTSAVPSGTPLPSNDWITGITPVWRWKSSNGLSAGMCSSGYPNDSAYITTR